MTDTDILMHSINFCFGNLNLLGNVSSLQWFTTSTTPYNIECHSKSVGSTVYNIHTILENIEGLGSLIRWAMCISHWAISDTVLMICGSASCNILATVYRDALHSLLILSVGCRVLGLYEIHSSHPPELIPLETWYYNGQLFIYTPSRPSSNLGQGVVTLSFL